MACENGLAKQASFMVQKVGEENDLPHFKLTWHVKGEPFPLLIKCSCVPVGNIYLVKFYLWRGVSWAWPAVILEG